MYESSRNTASTPGPNSEILPLLSSVENWINLKSLFLPFSCLETLRPGYYCLTQTAFWSQCVFLRTHFLQKGRVFSVYLCWMRRLQPPNLEFCVAVLLQA